MRLTDYAAPVIQRTRGVDGFLRDYQARPGHYREFQPASDLRDIVACTWVSVVRHGGFGKRSPIIPDGCSDIMLYDDGPPHVVGPDTRMRWADLQEGLVITGLRLRPGALQSVFRCEASELVDRQALLCDAAVVSRRFIAALSSAGDLQARHELLEDWVRHARRDFAAHDRMLLAASRRLAVDPHLPIGALARQLGWNARTIQRRFVAGCGYGPKHLQRVMRVQAALRVAHRGLFSLSDLASSAGFSDQAHMTREFKDLAGFTPSTYLAAYSPGVGAWLAADLSLPADVRIVQELRAATP